MNTRKWILGILTCLSLSALAHASSPSCTLSVVPDSGTAPLTVTAAGSCTDEDNDITLVTLDWGDGSPVETTNQTTITSTHTYNNPGKFRVTVTATDAQGNTGDDHHDVTVNAPPPPPPPNQPPTCKLTVTPKNGQAPLTVVANANCTDPDNNIVNVTIDWGDGTPPATGTQPNLAATHTYSKPGDFIATATATDAGGLQGSDTQKVHVTSAPPANQPPTCVLSAAPTSGQAPLTVTANGSCTDPEGHLASTSINWGDGTTTGGSSGTHTFAAAGSFTIVLTGTDNQGASGSASQHITVSGAPPPPPNQPPACTLSATPVSGEGPVSVTATASCTDANNDIAGIVISFGDGFYQSGPTAVHTFANGGTFTITATATDKAGQASKAVSQSVSITETPKLFVGVSDGEVREFSRNGTSLATLNTNQGGSITGMDVDTLDALYVTNFTANNVTKFTGAGALVGNFGSSYNCKPESIVFDQSGNAYVGQTGCSKSILKFDAYGNLFTGFSVATETQGSDWIDIAPDQCTILYTSEGPSILRFNACSNQQMPPFATGLQRGLAIRILPDGGAVVANNVNILRFDSGGRHIQTYDSAGHDCWATLTLDRSPSSFWAADFCTSDVVHFALDSGDQLGTFSSGTPANTVFGIAMKSAPQQTIAAGPLIASPNSASITAGQSATFSLAFSPNNAAANQNFTFSSCSRLPVGASCSFSPPSFTATSSGVTATLTINTAVRTASLAPLLRSQFFYAVFGPIGTVLLCVLSGGRPRRRKRTLLPLVTFCVLLLVLSAGFAAGCGGGADSNNSGSAAPGATGTTPAGNYTVGISVNSGSLTSSTEVSLSVR